MRVVIIIRLLFFALLITSISLFVFHSKLCINLLPNQLEKILSNCQHELQSTVSFDGSSLPTQNRKKRSIDNVNNILVRTKEIDEIEDTLMNITTTEIYQNTTVTQPVTNTTSTSTTTTTTIGPTTTTKKTISKKMEIKSASSEWHKLEFEEQNIRISTKSCFEYDFKYILTTDSSNISRIISPLRLLFILIITSFLLSLLDISLRHFLNTFSLVQTLVHNIIQLLIWCYILIYTEIFRRNWQSSWHEKSQFEHSPMYPGQWLLFEMVSFLIVMLIVIDTVTFNYSNYRLRIENSQGVYRIIEEEEERINKRKRIEENDVYLNSTVSTIM